VIPTDPLWLTHSMSARPTWVLAASSGGLAGLQVSADAGAAVTAGAKATASAMPRRSRVSIMMGTLQVSGRRRNRLFQQDVPLAVVAGQRCGRLEFAGGFVVASEPGQQLAANTWP
jgi:hypothetical protein